MNDAVESTFKLIRTASVVRARQFLDPARKADTVRALRAATLVTVESGDVNVTFTRAENVVRVTTGLLRAIDARAAELPPAKRANFTGDALMLTLAQTLANHWAISEPVHLAREGQRAMREVYSSVDECYAKELAESFARDEKVQLMRDRIKAYAHQPLATAPTPPPDSPP